MLKFSWKNIDKGEGGGIEASTSKQIIKNLRPNFTKKPWHGYHGPHTYKIIQQWMSRPASTNACWVINQFWRFHVENYEYSKRLPIFFQKFCSLKKLIFEIFNISTNNIISVEVAKVLTQVCVFWRIGWDLEPINFKLGRVYFFGLLIL